MCVSWESNAHDIFVYEISFENHHNVRIALRAETSWSSEIPQKNCFYDFLNVILRGRPIVLVLEEFHTDGQ